VLGAIDCDLIQLQKVPLRSDRSPVHEAGARAYGGYPTRDRSLRPRAEPEHSGALKFWVAPRPRWLDSRRFTQPSGPIIK
jgi:hypothetical protein